MDLGSALRATVPEAAGEELLALPDRLDEEEAGSASFFRILRAPDPELLDEPDDLAGADFSEPPDFLMPGEPDVRPWELPSRLMDVEPVPCPAARLIDSRPVPRSGTRLPELPSFLSMTRLPLSGWTEILVPDGRTFGACAEKLIFDRLFSVAESLTATLEICGSLSWLLRTTVRARPPDG